MISQLSDQEENLYEFLEPSELMLVFSRAKFLWMKIRNGDKCNCTHILNGLSPVWWVGSWCKMQLLITVPTLTIIRADGMMLITSRVWWLWEDENESETHLTTESETNYCHMNRLTSKRKGVDKMLLNHWTVISAAPGKARSCCKWMPL